MAVGVDIAQDELYVLATVLILFLAEVLCFKAADSTSYVSLPLDLRHHFWIPEGHGYAVIL